MKRGLSPRVNRCSGGIKIACCAALGRLVRQLAARVAGWAVSKPGRPLAAAAAGLPPRPAACRAGRAVPLAHAGGCPQASGWVEGRAAAAGLSERNVRQHAIGAAEWQRLCRLPHRLLHTQRCTTHHGATHAAAGRATLTHASPGAHYVCAASGEGAGSAAGMPSPSGPCTSPMVAAGTACFRGGEKACQASAGGWVHRVHSLPIHDATHTFSCSIMPMSH